MEGRTGGALPKLDRDGDVAVGEARGLACEKSPRT